MVDQTTANGHLNNLSLKAAVVDRFKSIWRQPMQPPSNGLSVTDQNSSTKPLNYLL
jgi:hypothetical protein